MSWVAFSSSTYNYDKRKFFNRKHGISFRIAAKFARLVGDGVIAGDLSTGTISCTSVKYLLQDATGRSCYEDWSAAEVKYLAENTDWRDLHKYYEPWAYWSARMFLETCAELGLAVTFSY